MRNTINLLKLVFMLLSKNKIKESLLAVEVSLMVFLITFTLVPISNALNLVGGIENAATTSSMIYCVPSPSNAKAVPINEIKDTIIKDYGITPKIFATESFSCKIDSQPNNAYFLLVSEDLFSNIDVDLKSGEFIDTKGESVSVIISSHLAEQYSLGDTINCVIDSQTIECIVSGILKSNSTIIDVNKQEGSRLTVDALGFNMVKYNGDFVIAVTNSQIAIAEDRIDSALFVFPNETETDEMISALNESYSNRYNFHSFTSLRDNTVQISISNMDWRIVLLFLFVIVVVFNFIGYIVINTRQKQKVLSVMNICGLSFAKSLAINITSLMIIVLPALLIGLLCSPYMLNNMNVEYYGFNVFLGVAIALIFVGVVIVAIITSMWQKKHIATINLYKRG